MSIFEYSVSDSDFFQVDSERCGDLNFPCCVCNFAEKEKTEYPCRYCGHIENDIEYFRCSLCEEIQEGNPYTDGKIIAEGTKAQIKYVCEKCFTTIKLDMQTI